MTTTTTPSSRGEKPKGGRPRKVVDWNAVELLASWGCTQEEIAATLQCDRNTLTRGRNAKVFQQILAGGSARACASLRRFLFSVVRGKLVEADGSVTNVPIQERVRVACFLATRRQYLALEDANHEAPPKPAEPEVPSGPRVLRIVVKGGVPPDFSDPKWGQRLSIRPTAAESEPAPAVTVAEAEDAPEEVSVEL